MKSLLTLAITGSTQNLSESGKPNRKRGSKKPKSGKQVFNSRRNISKSEPQGQNQLDGIDQQETDAQISSFPGPGRRGHNERLTRRRSSAPADALTSMALSGPGNQSSIIQNGWLESAVGDRERGEQAGHARNSRRSGARRSSESSDADLDGGNRIIAPANSPIAKPRT
jgi:hypothetical protein